MTTVLSFCLSSVPFISLTFPFLSGALLQNSPSPCRSEPPAAGKDTGPNSANGGSPLLDTGIIQERFSHRARCIPFAVRLNWRQLKPTQWKEEPGEEDWVRKEYFKISELFLLQVLWRGFLQQSTNTDHYLVPGGPQSNKISCSHSKLSSWMVSGNITSLWFKWKCDIWSLNSMILISFEYFMDTKIGRKHIKIFTAMLAGEIMNF